ncbi:probable BUB3-interacting and GLEBS motif-containing protein ZNF207 at N-terminal half [Coccomyxa sp. Obi]|nr:probable BUB3-interacting and GLEBS motif-containing protein ZNF207 at N-terminal half [Coccomyxa sp. Obi]
MVRKKKKREAEQPPWCYYCDRVFSDESTLIQHQKAKHFKCTTCHRKLTSASGLRVHCHQVHRFTLDKVPAAIPGRDSIELEVFGMSGVPEGAVPGVPILEGDVPSSKAARNDAASPSAPPSSQLPPPPQPLCAVHQPHVMPPHGLHPVSGVAAQPLGHIATGYTPQVMHPLVRPGAYPGMIPPWPTPALPRSLPVPLPGAYLQPPAFPLGTTPAPAPAAPLFPIATDHSVSASPGQHSVANNTQSMPNPRVSELSTAAEQYTKLSPSSVSLHPNNGGPAHELSVEEVRAGHKNYRSRILQTSH